MSEFTVRDRRDPGHFWGDNEVIDIYGPQIGLYGIAVYMLLARQANNRSGECRVSLRKLASQGAVSHSTILEAVRKLLDCGLVKLQSQGDRVNPSVYVLASVKNLVCGCIETTVVAESGPVVVLRPRNKEKKDSFNTKSNPLPPFLKTENQCKRHPQSGLSNWGTCWACYAESYGYKIEPGA